MQKKTAQGFIQFMLFMVILLFGPAWTFNFWPAWIYMLVFAVSIILITWDLWKKDPDLLERRINAGPGAEKEKKQKLIQLVTSLVFVSLFIIASLDHRFFWSHVPVQAIVAGDVLTALGFLAVYFVFKENTFTAATIEVATEQKVISTGPYAIVRHPMYAGALIMIFGTPLALGSYWALIGSCCMLLGIAWRLINEETFLIKNLPGYGDYRQKVKYRLIPFIW